MNASRDANSVPTLLGALQSNGTTTIPIKANAAFHGLMVDDNTTGSNFGPVNAPRDENDVPVLMAVSSADGVTPIPIYATSDGKLLVNSN